MGAVGKGLSKGIGNMSRGEMAGMSVGTGVTAGTINNIINQHYIDRGHQRIKQAWYKRKLKNGKIITVQKAANHGIGHTQRKGV